MVMGNWYLGTIRYDKIMENGMQKKVSEKYLLDAYSCTEAEARLINEMEPFISGEFQVKSVKEESYSEVVPSDDVIDDIWFKFKIAYITLDEKTGNEKKTSTNILVQASDIRRSITILDEYMKGSLSDYVIDSVSDSGIMDVYFYGEKQDGED